MTRNWILADALKEVIFISGIIRMGLILMLADARNKHAADAPGDQAQE
jgi:hypothetical protein